jgi:hypothetical protein
MIKVFNRFKRLTLVSMAGASLFITLPVLAQVNSDTRDEASVVSQAESLEEAPSETNAAPSQPVSEQAESPEEAPSETNATPSQPVGEEAPAATSAAPGEPVSETELQQLANVVPELQAIQESAQTEVMTVVEESGLSPERFNQIAQAQTSPEVEAEAAVEITPDEQTAFETVFNEIQRIEQEFLTQREQLLQAEGLTVERYKEIMAAVQQDPALLQQVEEML